MEKSEATNRKTVHKIIIGACAVFLVLLIVALIINLVRLSAVNSRARSLAAISAELDTRIDENGKMIDFCSTDEFYEMYAREYLDMVYRDETIIDVK